MTQSQNCTSSTFHSPPLLHHANGDLLPADAVDELAVERVGLEASCAGADVVGAGVLDGRPAVQVGPELLERPGILPGHGQTVVGILDIIQVQVAAEILGRITGGAGREVDPTSRPCYSGRHGRERRTRGRSQHGNGDDRNHGPTEAENEDTADHPEDDEHDGCR
jgi:hypothetical protein